MVSSTSASSRRLASSVELAVERVEYRELVGFVSLGFFFSSGFSFVTDEVLLVRVGVLLIELLRAEEEAGSTTIKEAKEKVIGGLKIFYFQNEITFKNVVKTNSRVLGRTGGFSLLFSKSSFSF